MGRQIAMISWLASTLAQFPEKALRVLDQHRLNLRLTKANGALLWLQFF
jgi:hypothetical protein